MTIWTFIRSVSATDSITLAFDHFEGVSPLAWWEFGEAA
jgi:hypothetical protein